MMAIPILTSREIATGRTDEDLVLCKFDTVLILLSYDRTIPIIGSHLRSGDCDFYFNNEMISNIMRIDKGIVVGYEGYCSRFYEDLVLILSNSVFFWYKGYLVVLKDDIGIPVINKTTGRPMIVRQYGDTVVEGVAISREQALRSLI